MAKQADTTSAPLAAAAPEGAFFSLLDWSAFWAATLVTLAVYCYTLAPTVTLEDSGELATAGAFLGVPHPPGYPIWTLISWIFTKIFAFVPYRGQPNPAWSIGLVSAVFGALASGITAMLICRSGRDLLHESRDVLHQAGHQSAGRICWIAGVASSLLFSFSPAEWSQSVIVEVYSLNAFFLVLIFLLTYRWIYKPTNTLLVVTAFVFGLGMTNYQVILLAIMPLCIAIMLRDTRLFRGLLLAGAPFILVYGLISKGYLPNIPQPLSPICFFYVALNLLLLTLVYFFMPRGRVIALAIFMAELGVGFYAMMPLVSDLRNPPMNWGFPRTYEGFLHALTRGQYEKIVPTDALSMKFVQQLGSYFTDLRAQFTLPVALLGFLPFTVWHLRIRERRLNGLSIAIVLTALAVGALVLESVLQATIGWKPMRLDKLFVAGVMLMMCLGGVTIMAQLGWELWERMRGVTTRNWPDRITVGGIFVVTLGIYAFLVKALTAKIGMITAPLHQKGVAITPEMSHSLMMQGVGLVIIMLMPALLAAVGVWLTRGRFALRMTIDDNSQKWVVATLFGFLVMSLMLIILANPKGDVQDNFIQRVKFISSHALYAFWIGYGLVFGLAWVDTIFKRIPALSLASLLCALALPAIPILQNAHNTELVRLSGGSEQNGHDFGWQFGNYQLRGAEAIIEELASDEEPLPNPTYPPPMGPDAVFFGGTDPGRFVPTYMIYSAGVREDVYLITQNALADNTFMNVTRDLYGDQIWIPAQQDSAQAFRIYVDEVQSGKRSPNAELTIDNGRVQVSGALGVMEINGILAEMIFKHNNWRHDFYVEESYVIQWMYPYLTPHGLIMKINKNTTGLPPDNVRDDLDFWDWYTRRMIDNPKFLRDVVARKSFSKLRSAIGGLYSNRGRLREAEHAFHEARMLYPLSPEANFRLVQEVYLREGRFAESRAIMEEYAKDDPGNDRVPEFIQQLNRLGDLDSRIHALEAKRQSGVIDIASALELAESYRQAQQNERFMAVIDSITATTNLPVQYLYQVATLLYQAKQYPRMDQALQECLNRLPPGTPPEIYLNMARMYADGQMPARMVRALQLYVQARPDDWKAWLDLAYVYLTVKQNDAAQQALAEARRYGGAEADALISRDDRFSPVTQGAPPPSAMNLMNLPGVAP